MKFFIIILLVIFCNQSFAQQFSECEKGFLTVKPANPEQLIQHITEGAMLSRGQELEFLFYLTKTFREERHGKGLKDVLDKTDLYLKGELDKLLVREQEITFTIKNKNYPESLSSFLKSFRSRANKTKKLFYISNNWRLWAKLLLFETQATDPKQNRAEFFKLLNSTPFGQPANEFIKDLYFYASNQQTVKEFIESPLTHYRQKTIVLYKVMDVFRENSIKQGRQDLSENLSIAMAELIHATGFNNQNYLNQLKNKDPLKVMEAVRQILLERDTISMDLGFNDWHYKGLTSFLLDSLNSSRVKKFKNELSKIENDELKILKELDAQKEVDTFTETFRLRPLSLQESPFRGCLGKDCSTRTYFDKALDPAYLYFTLTDSEFISHGQITIILGTATNKNQELVKTAFLDQIQNIPNHRIIGTLEAIKKSLNEQGYLLAIPENLGTNRSGLSNTFLTRMFVKDNILPFLKNELQAFEPKKTDLDFEDSNLSRAGLKLDLLEFDLTNPQSDFNIQALQTVKPKKIDESFKMHDWFLKVINSSNEKDQIVFLESLPELVMLNLFSFKEALGYLQLKIQNKDLSFNLRKQALFTAIKMTVLTDYHSVETKAGIKKVLKDFKFIEFLLLEFSKTELATLISEMSNWKNSHTEYKKSFIKILSYLFHPKLLYVVINSPTPGLFEFVANLNIKAGIKEETALHRAVSSGDLKTIRFLINKGVDLDIKDYHGGETPLHLAVEKRDKKIIQLLLQAGANPNIKNKFNQTALQIVEATNSHKEIFNLLLQAGADPNNKSLLGSTKLHNVVYRGATEILQLFFEWGANLKIKEHGNRPLHTATEAGHKRIVELLLQKGIDPNTQNDKGETALHIASNERFKQIVSLLLKRGANPNIKDRMGRTALLNAIGSGAEHIVKLLLKAGANPNIRTFFIDNALNKSIDQGLTSLIINNGDNIALHKATYFGYKKIVRILLNAGANPNIQNEFGNTVLHTAIRGWHQDIVKLLLKAGADLTIKNNYGDTLLHKAVKMGHTPIVLLLLKQGVDPNIKNNNGNTALHYAAIQEYKQIIYLLYKWGADLDSKNNQGKTALYFATSKEGKNIYREEPQFRFSFHYSFFVANFNNQNTAQLLLDLGANPKIEDYKEQNNKN